MSDWPNPNKVAIKLARERRERGEHKKPRHCACGHHRIHHQMGARVGHGKRCQLCPCTSYSRLKEVRSMTGPQLDLMEGRRRRDREIEGHRERKSALLEEIDARLVSLSKARSTGIVDADDAHRILDEMLEEPPWAGPDLSDRRAFGGLFGRGWTKVGYAPSRRKECKARPIAQWRWDGE